MLRCYSADLGKCKGKRQFIDCSASVRGTAVVSGMIEVCKEILSGQRTPAKNF